MAEQIAAASQAIALIPPLPDSMYATLSARLEAIERSQERLETEVTRLVEKVEADLVDHRQHYIEVEAGNGTGKPIEGIEKTVKELKDELKLE